jgi:hypothetical protein
MFGLHAGYYEVDIASEVVKLLMSLIFLKKFKYDNPFESLFCKFIMKMPGTCFVAHHGFHESVIFFSVTCLAEFIMSYLKSQIFFMPLYCHILREALYPLFS